jgi:hypothetical protein
MTHGMLMSFHTTSWLIWLVIIDVVGKKKLGLIEKEIICYNIWIVDKWMQCDKKINSLLCFCKDNFALPFLFHF